MPSVPSIRRHEVRLGSGLRVVCVPQPAAHSVAIALFVRVGSRYERRRTSGLSHFLEHMLYRGTRAHPSAHDQALAFERLGGTLYAVTHTDHGVASVRVPPESFGEALALLADVVLRPRLGEIEVERGIVREEILESLDEGRRQIDADNLSRALLYGAHPLGLPITGDLASLRRFDRRMLRRHHARHYTGNGSVLCVAGPVAPSACARLARRLFAAMRPGAPVRAVPPPPIGRRPRLRYVPNTSSQTELRVAFRAVGDRHPIEPAVECLLRVLDDGMSARLYDRLCDSRGLCYDVSAAFEAYDDDGVLDVAAETQHARAIEVLREILGLCAALASDGPSPGELEKVLTRHAWQVAAMTDDVDALAAFHGLSTLARVAPTPAERQAQLERVRPEDVRDAARAVFRRERAGIVAVGLLGRAQRRRMVAAVDEMLA